MKTPQELKTIAEAHGWEATVTQINGIDFSHSLPSHPDGVYRDEDGIRYTSEQFRAVRGNEEATIATKGYIYACIWPRKDSHGDGLRKAGRSYPGNSEYHYPEASEWMAEQLRKGTPFSIRFRNWLAHLWQD